MMLIDIVDSWVGAHYRARPTARSRWFPGSPASRARPSIAASLRVLSPQPKQALARALAGVRRVVVMEQNHGAHLYHHLVAHQAIPPGAESFARPGPLPFRPAEITAHLA